MRKEKTPWEKRLDKSKSNIGFITKVGAFKDPSPAEIAACLAIETKSWQATKGTVPYKISEPYNVARGAGFNLKSDRDLFHPIEKTRREAAIRQYVETPLDNEDKTLAKQKIDVRPYEEPETLFSKLKGWFNRVIYRYNDPIRTQAQIDFEKSLEEKK